MRAWEPGDEAKPAADVGCAWRAVLIHFHACGCLDGKHERRKGQWALRECCRGESMPVGPAPAKLACGWACVHWARFWALDLVQKEWALGQNWAWALGWKLFLLGLQKVKIGSKFGP